MASSLSEAEVRQKTLESLFSEKSSTSQDESFSIETLLDSLVVLYDECRSSSFKREKTVTEFIDNGEREDCTLV
jgi:serine/threonine-protein kinase MRCK